MSTRTCQTCGRELTDGVKFCPNCGTPVMPDSRTDSTQTNTVFVAQEPTPGGSVPAPEPNQTSAENSISASSVPPPPYILSPDMTYPAPVGYPPVTVPVKRSRKWVIPVIIVAVVLVLVASAVVFFFLREQKSQKIRNEYIDNLNAVTGFMIIGGEDAESLCNLTARVWRNCIWKDSDSETDKFTKPYGHSFYDDFNDALNALYSDEDTLDTLSNILTNQSLVKSIMEELREPPQEFEKCYDTLTELYSAYQGLTGLAMSPVGSYNSYTDSMNNKVDKFLEYYKKVINLIPEKE